MLYPAAVTTLSTAHLKVLRSLLTPQGRRAQSAFLIEGDKLVRDALAAGAHVREILAPAAHLTSLAPPATQITLTTITAAQARRLTDTRTPQGSFALVEDTVPDASALVAALPNSGALTILALDGVQDPGNLGALIRVGASFGLDAILCGAHGADPTQPKVVRAATGAWFRTRLARARALPVTLTTLHDAGLQILGASTTNAAAFHDVAPAPRRVLVVGGEGGGITTAVAAVVDAHITVPMDPGVESLNVAVAAGIILAHWQRLSAT